MKIPKYTRRENSRIAAESKLIEMKFVTMKYIDVIRR